MREAQTVRLADETDVAGFRAAARRLVLGGVEPSQVQWQVASAAAGELFAGEAESPELPAATRGGATAEVRAAEPAAERTTGGSTEETPNERPRPAASARLTLPAWFVDLCERALLHRDPNRFGLIYRLVWRLVHEPGLRDDPLDADRVEAERLARAVRRDMHKMTAFVRFRPLGRPGAEAGAEGVEHLAWFEPLHHVVEATAPFFARRFAQMRWAILSPDRCARWDGRALNFGPGASRDAAPPADADERLWLTYYESIFNPARLKLAMMRKEMPRHYWKNLPEAVLIEPLAARAAERSGRMIERPACAAAHRRPSASIALRVAPAPEAAAERAAIASLPALREALEHCRDCPIGRDATQAVAGAGAARARLMLVGEQPGDQEDLRGQPFVGPAGQLLDRALAQLGWQRDALFLTNAVKHFKFELRGKRRIHKTPAQQEAAACLQWLERELELVDPEAVIALGATAARSLLGRAVAVTRERGQWLARADGRRVLVTLHPSALLRMEPADREAAFDAWLEDLRIASPIAAAAPR